MSKKSVLSDREQRTHEAYGGKKAIERANERSDFNLWLPEINIFLDFVIRAWGANNDLIEIGCGSSSRDARLFHKIKNTVTYIGISFQEDEVKESHMRLPSASFLTMDANSLGFRDHAFNAAWSVATLLHIERRKVRQTLFEIKRILMPGAIVFISLKEGKTEEDEVDYEGRLYIYYQLEEFAEILENCGFKMLRKNRVFKIHSPERLWLEYFVEVEN